MKRLPGWAREGREQWQHTGRARPPFAKRPSSGQESVWDYPRPPRLAPDTRTVEIRLGDVVVARSDATIRVLETASPPTFYLPEASVMPGLLEPSSGVSRCEWKGEAQYWSIVTATARLDRVAWSYPEPFPEFEPIRRHFAFYPHELDCTVDGERVLPQPGRFYAGWVTREIVGPFKGEPGSEAW